MVIAIDGPAGSGKSTTARYTAERLGFIHIKDLNLLLFKILFKFKKNFKNQTYNVGSGKPTNIKKLVEIYENQAKIKIKYNLKKINKTELKSVFADIKKVKSDFSWSPRHTIRSIVKSYI